MVLNESMPGTNLSWEGDQGDDAFFPFRLRNGSWLGFFGSALSRREGGWNHDWHVGLARASSLGGPWTKATERNPMGFDQAVENPVVTMTQDKEYYMAVYFPFAAGTVGFIWSRDGVQWSQGVHLNITASLQKPCGGNPVTALGLVPAARRRSHLAGFSNIAAIAGFHALKEPQLGPGTYSLLFTGRAGSTNGFENVCAPTNAKERSVWW